MAAPNGSFAGKTALITGAGKRLGRACALALAGRGAGIVVHYRTSEKEAQETAEEIQALGAPVWLVSGDQGEPAEAEAFFRRAVDRAGTIDYLVNSASIFPESRLNDFSFDDLMNAVRINAYGPLVLCRALASQQREGAIVNFLDARITDYDKLHVAYHLAKRMLFTLTRMMALELAPHVRVNAVAPGLVLPPEGKDDSYLRDLAHTNPLNTVGGVQDIAEAVVYLLGARFVTGQVLYVDGGRHIHGNTYGA